MSSTKLRMSLRQVESYPDIMYFSQLKPTTVLGTSEDSINSYKMTRKRKFKNIYKKTFENNREFKDLEAY